ncbi:MAG: DEAD/DEAH box helicase family protein [Clostridia bacterium]|nr:DEAD/DEAH box helicase family protein [Clostridia bacterium]
MEAYESALSMLRETGKAAIIHPTGTGKSFIGFKICEDFPESTVCWLSPSEYIFKTQIENLKAVSNGYTPQNIKFFTYAKLMNMTKEELLKIAPDYIILDEFHRCGAEMWGLGVQKLLQLYSKTSILGLSATAVRYLDNQRDMSNELFDGNVASEMALGEAIVRGILNPPKYVLSVFSYQKELEKYEQRIRFAKNKAVRDAGEKYLEAIRRALEKADGMDVIFDKHMTDRKGKYIVFCANFEHMNEMIDLAPMWFAKVDKNPHIYTVYSDDSTTSCEFAAFKSDESEHLKLLYCIDMLNEGVHVEDVCGVIYCSQYREFI